MNSEIKMAIKNSGMKQWQVAKACKVAESTFVRWLRDELSEDRKAMILSAIDELAKGERHE